VIAALVAAAALVVGLSHGDGGETVAAAGFEPGGSPGPLRLEQSNGAIALTAAVSYRGAGSAAAAYSGGGANGYARGVAQVRWENGATVTYGAAFLLPHGFTDRLAAPVALVRWDNWPSHGEQGDVGGLYLFESDRRVHLVHGGYRRGFEGDLLASPPVPEGRWFHVEVRQRLARSSPALNELRIDGRVVGRSTAANMGGRTIERLRFGIVALSSGAQTEPLELNFDDASYGSALRGPR
jgi:hypothetical protein